MEVLEFLKQQLNSSAAQRIGTGMGLPADKAQSTLAAVWPLQLDALATHAQAPQGARQLLDFAASVPSGSVDILIERPGSLHDLEQLGASLSPTLLGSNATTINTQVAQSGGTPLHEVERLSNLSLPLLLKLILEYAHSHSLGAAGMGGLLLTLRPELAALLPAALAPLIGSFVAPSAALPAAAATLTSAPPTEHKRRGAGWLWAIPLAVLLLVGGCFVVNRTNQTNTNQNAANQIATSETAGTESNTAPAETMAELNVSEPVANATLPSSAFVMRGQGKAGETVSIKDGANVVGSATIGADGNWSTEIAAPTAGQHTYAAQSTSGNAAQLRVTVAEADASTPATVPSATTPTTDASSTATTSTDATGTEATSTAPDTTAATSSTTDASSTDANSTAASDTAAGGDTTTSDTAANSTEVTSPDTANADAANTEATNAASTATPITPVTINTPSKADQTGPFDLSGNGTAGQVVNVFEDGANIGAATVDDAGTWTLSVPSPTSGKHQYLVRAPDGSEAVSSVTVGADKGDATACTQAFTLSLNDGQTVTSPFRFGGQGSANGYSVAVKRGERTVGTKVLPVSGSCGWSYSSNPGQGEITYVVRSGQDFSAAPMSTITLDVQ